MSGQGVNRFPRGDGQDDAGVLDLEPGQASAVGHGVQEGKVGVRDGQRTGFATTHGIASASEVRRYSQHTRRPEFVALLVARATRGPFSCVGRAVNAEQNVAPAAEAVRQRDEGLARLATASIRSDSGSSGDADLPW